MLDRLFGSFMHNAGAAIGNAIGESVGDVIEGVTTQATRGITNEMAAKNQARQNELNAANQAQQAQLRAQNQMQEKELQLQNQAKEAYIKRQIQQADVDHELAVKEQKMISDLPAKCPHCSAPTSKSLTCEFCGCKIVE